MKKAAAPYRRIAAELKERVLLGQLEPGDKLPSTRQLCAEFGVAHATATHVLRTLVEEGVAQAVPRVGTVVASKRGHPGRAEADLSPARIIKAAIELADAEGLESFSLRGVASKMGVPPMSLYRHVDGKGGLIERMVETALEEEELPEKPPAGWRAQLELAARIEWRLVRRHPWLARVMQLSRPKPIAASIALTDWVLRALEETQLDPGERLRVQIVLHAYLQGMALNLEEEARAASETGIDEDEFMRQNEAQFAALGARFPAFGRFMRDVGDFELDLDEIFELGLRTLLDGVAASVVRTATRRPRPRSRN